MGIFDKLFRNVVRVEVTPQYQYFDLIVSLATVLLILYIARIYTNNRLLLVAIGAAAALVAFGFV